MSAVYATEPPFTGRVVLETTHGPLELQLWCKECPETTRHFLRRCVDGFYDDMVFHRVVPKFLIQAGAVRNDSNKKKQTAKSQHGGRNDSTTIQEALEKEALSRRQNWNSYATYRAAIEADRALERRKYEVHSRLRFSHRGIVAMALAVQEDPAEGGDESAELMQPQFFLTLDEATFLDGKHVIFGSCTGPTYFNAVRISQVDFDEATSMPNEWNDSPRILRVKVMEAPNLDGFVPQSRVPWKVEEDSAAEMSQQQNKSKTKKRKGKLDVNVLSFGDEVMGDDCLPVVSKQRDSTARKAASLASGDNGVSDGAAARSRPRAKVDEDDSPASARLDFGNGEQRRDSRSHPDGPLSQAVSTDRINGTSPLDGNGEQDREKPSSTSQPSSSKAEMSIVEMRKRQFAAAARARAHKVRVPGDDSITKRRPREGEDDTMAKLMAFQSNLKRAANSATASTASAAARNGGDKGGGLASRMARRAQEELQGGASSGADLLPTYRGQVLENDDADEDGKNLQNDWMRTQFRCRRSAGGNVDPATDDALVGGDGRRADDYQVVDDRDRHRKHRDDAGREHNHHKSKRHHSKYDRPSHDRHRRRDGRG